jgi:hypothetical protein
MGDALDTAQELDRLRALVLKSSHDLANSVGVALNYVAFLEEDLGGADSSNLAPIESALRRAAETVRVLRESARAGL